MDLWSRNREFFS